MQVFLFFCCQQHSAFTTEIELTYMPNYLKT